MTPRVADMTSTRVADMTSTYLPKSSGCRGLALEITSKNVSDRFVVPTVASAIDVVVHLGVRPDGVRQVREVVAVTGRVEAGRVETATLFHRPRLDGELVRGDGFPSGEDRFARVGVDVRALLAGAR